MWIVCFLRGKLFGEKGGREKKVIHLLSYYFILGFLSDCNFATCLNPSLKIQILTTLRRNLSLPVTCKIRLLKSPHDTVELARRIEKAGVDAIAVHGR